MPLIVHCPTGCLLRVPLARAGSIVRCSECKSVIQLRSLSHNEESQKLPVELFATLVTSTHADSKATLVDAPLPSPEEDRSESFSGAQTIVDRAIVPQLDPSELDQFELPIPQPARLRFGSGKRKRKGIGHANRKSAKTFDSAGIDMGQPMPDTAPDLSGIDLLEPTDDEPSDEEFRFLSQSFAFCLATLGVFLTVPSLLAWNGWTTLPVESQGSRWIPIMIFLGALHFVYAIFLFQIQDRAALWSVAIFLLAVGCIHGVFTAGTWLDAGVGPVSRFLQVPHGEATTLTLWCLLHLCFAILLCYLCGRQALLWKQRLIRAANSK